MGFQMMETSNQDQLVVNSISLRGKITSNPEHPLNTAFFSISFVPSRIRAGLEGVGALLRERADHRSSGLPALGPCCKPES